jgi:CBS domain-containing protein
LRSPYSLCLSLLTSLCIYVYLSVCLSLCLGQQALKRPIEDILTREPLLATSETELISTALSRLSVHSALPVFEREGPPLLLLSSLTRLTGAGSDGRIVANLSATDFISLSPTTDLSQLTVSQFLAQKMNEGVGEGATERDVQLPAAVCITSKGSILTAALFMIENHIHRVWVVAPSDYSGLEGYGIGCISLTDVLTTIALFSR